MDATSLTLDDLTESRRRIEPHAHRTPVLTCRSLDERAGRSVFLKCENFQRAGAFKFRGACNVLSRMSAEQLARGVATHSSGNHAQALALAARLFGASARIVMPRNAPEVKRRATEGYGARITLCQPTLAAREAACADVIASTGATMVHPYDNDWIIAGQATAALELLEAAPDLELILAPVGGGGLLSGTALAAATRSPAPLVIGCAPARADDAFESMRAGRLIRKPAGETCADGLLTNLCERTFAIIERHVEEIIRVGEEEILEAMRFIWERMKIVIEPSSAVAVAPLLFQSSSIRGRRVGVILSGGNVSLALDDKQV